MDHAWLDSLSEDWVSQPGSDTSTHLPPLKETEHTEPSQSPTQSTRIHRRTLSARPGLAHMNDNSISILSERSANEINISRQRLPTKLSQEIKPSRSGTTRTVSGASNGSVVHNTVQNQSSPSRSKGQTPEWKRRLVYGDLQYGEQRDLFCSAAAGLQDMFKPPALADETFDLDGSERHETTMPSSPPPYHHVDAADLHVDLDIPDEDDHDYPEQVTPSPSPRRTKREIQYRLNLDESGLDESVLANRHGQRHRPTASMPGPEDSIYRDQSCLTAASEDDGTSRKISGQSDTRNEDFSPILIGKHSDEDGRVDFAPIEIPVDQLREKLERLRMNQMLLDSQVHAQISLEAAPAGGSVNIETTEDYMHYGGFINVQRGGRSGDGSFYNRGLSSDLAVDSSEMLPEESLQASTPKQFPTIRTEGTNPYPTFNHLQSPSLPRAPFPSPEKRQTRGDGGASGGSPLKLFGPYDTYTNQTLLRRISQFEEGMSGTTSRQSEEDEPSHIDEASPAASSPRQPRYQAKPAMQAPRTVSRFGIGDLEGFEFSGDLSYASNDDSGLPEVDVDSPKLTLPTAPRFGQPPGGLSPDEESELLVRRRRTKSSSSMASKHTRIGSASSQMRKSISLPMDAPDLAGTPKRDSGSEGKRPRTSPSKDPTPKRRRTLHQSDIAFGRENQLAAIDSAHQQIQYVLGKKRKDARPGDFELADPSVLALRSILRPRTPTPSQRSSQQRELHPLADDQSKPKKSVARTIQNEIVPLSSDAPNETARKPSIRTQDFVDQAAQIMAMIRSQVRAPVLASMEESELELGPVSPRNTREDSYQESTNEPFSRPPSREGKPLPRMPQRQEDPELVDRLKQYQELSDMGEVVSSSLRAMGLTKDAIRAAQMVDQRLDGPLVTDGDVISDLRNVRLSTNPASRSPSRDFPSNSSGNSTNHTYPSASSRGSDSRRTIMPESVSHLIPDRVGSMYLDKQKNIWIKKKDGTPMPKVDVPPSEDSDEDPFASIPDLSVDMTKEMHDLRLTGRNESAKGGEPGSPSSPSKLPQNQSNRGYVTLSPNAQLSPRMAALARGECEKLDNLSLLDDDDEEALPSLHEEKFSNPPSTRRRNLTISFSSPIASIIQDVVAEDLDSLEDDPDTGDEPSSASISPSRSPVQPIAPKPALKNGGQGSLRNGSQGPRRQPSGRGPAFFPRPVSRIDEQDEDSTIEVPVGDDRQLSLIGDNSLVSHRTPGARHTSLSFIINHTPGNHVVARQAEDSAVIGHNVGKLSLSPLSEFTLNNSDQSFGFEVSYVMGHRHLATGDGSKRVLSMTIRELVDKLSEVEPYEPYWEDITELDLQEKRLTSLHMLDEFCGKVVTLDASKNALGHLDGVPSSVRQLKVSQNMLTELTSWDHLMNLQYVDISGNEVKSLSALKNLVHLRSIKADNNQLTSLDGLDMHDGVLSLRARDNLIEEVDFAYIKLDRLVELDLGGNSISVIRNLDLLPALARLKLPRNQLHKLTLDKTVTTLRQLDVSDNDISMLDISNLPNLHSLHADRNRIYEISGFSRARRLDSLSLREQHGECSLNLGFLASAYEVRKLFLSGNYLGTFDLQVDFLNLQLLELANCGLVALPEKLGQLMPNLRTLNINMNGIPDLSPLRFIPRLKKLLVAGNRLMDSTEVTQLLIDFPHLTQLDLRHNPMTLGFYPPMQVLVPTDGSGCPEQFVLPEADVERDETFASRLDEATRLRRRLHQVVLAASCKRLRRLDGLPIKRREVLARDGLMEMLVAEGLVADDEGARDVVSAEGAGAGRQDGSQRGGTVKSSRWNAEDSFA